MRFIQRNYTAYTDSSGTQPRGGQAILLLTGGEEVVKLLKQLVMNFLVVSITARAGPSFWDFDSITEIGFKSVDIW